MAHGERSWNVFIIRVTVPAKRQVSIFSCSWGCFSKRAFGVSTYVKFTQAGADPFA
jgi:hypothetical protein